MIAMRYGFMTASRAVDVIGIVALMPVFWCATNGVRLADLDLVLIHVIFVHVMEMPIVQIVDMAIMPDGDVAASWTMLVIVSLVVRVFAFRHQDLPKWPKTSLR